MSLNNAKTLLISDMLKRKSELYNEIYNITSNQEMILFSDEPDMDMFEEMMNEKKIRIDQIEKVDEQFEKIYKDVKMEESPKELIKTMQEEIKKLNDMSVKIKVTEEKNKKKLEQNILDIKNKYKNVNKNVKNIAKYKNVAGYNTESFFMDKKN